MIRLLSKEGLEKNILARANSICKGLETGRNDKF